MNKDIRNQEIICKMLDFLKRTNFVLMEDGTYHNIDFVIRVEFKKNVIRVDQFIDQYRYGIYEWRRLFSCFYKRLQFTKDGTPSGLGFNSHPYLIKIIEEAKKHE